MAAPKGNQNARKGEHSRLLLGISNQGDGNNLLDDLYTCMQAEIGKQDEEYLRGYIRSLLRDNTRDILARVNGEPMCSVCEVRAGDVWCSLCEKHFCGFHYEKLHLHEDEE